MAKNKETTYAEERLKEIQECQEHVDRMKDELERKKEETKDARESWESAVDHLGAVIRDNEERPLLDTAENAVTFTAKGKEPVTLSKKAFPKQILAEVSEQFEKKK